MSYSWEKRLASNLTNAEHMRDLRKRISTEHEERLRLRERSREEAEIKRAARKAEPPTRTDKYKNRSYDRPWVVKKTGTPKTSDCAKSSSSDSCQSASGARSRLPEIKRQSQPTEPKTPITRQQFRSKKTAESRPKDKSSFGQANKCSRVNTPKQPMLSAGSACYQSVNNRCTSSDTSVSLSRFGMNKQPLKSNGERLHPLSRAGKRLPSLSPGSPLSESTSGWQKCPELLQDVSDLDSCMAEEVEETGMTTDSSEGAPSSVVSTDTISTESCFSSSHRVVSPLCHPCVMRSTRDYFPSKDPPLDLSRGLGDSSPECLGRDLTSLEPITSESEEEEDMEEKAFDSWHERWRWPISLTPSPTTPFSSVSGVVAAAAVGFSCPEVGRVGRATAGRFRGYLHQDALSPVLSQASTAESPIPVSDNTVVFNTVVHQGPDRFLSLLDHTSPITAHEMPDLEPSSYPSWQAQPSRPVASSVFRTASPDRDEQSHSRVSNGTDRDSNGDQSSDEESYDRNHSVGSLPEDPASGLGSPVAPNEASALRGMLVIRAQMGSAVMAMRQLSMDIQGLHWSSSHGASGPSTSLTRGTSVASQDADLGHNGSNDGSTVQASEGRTRADPETLERITQRLLEEPEEEEEGDQCRICQSGAATPSNPLLSPCQCSGSLKFIHHDCLQKWIHTKIQSGADMLAVTTCELCKEPLQLDLEDFDVAEGFRQCAEAESESNSENLQMLLESYSLLMAVLHEHISDLAQDTAEREELEAILEGLRGQSQSVSSTGQAADTNSTAPF